MMETNTGSYIILYQFNPADHNSKGFLRCKNQKELFHTITKIGINIHQNFTNKQGTINFRQLLAALRAIPFLKVYQMKQNFGQLTQVPSFHHLYRQYIKESCKQTQDVYNLIKQASKSQQYVKNQLYNLIHTNSDANRSIKMHQLKQQINQQKI